MVPVKPDHVQDHTRTRTQSSMTRSSGTADEAMGRFRSRAFPRDCESSEPGKFVIVHPYFISASIYK